MRSANDVTRPSTYRQLLLTPSVPWLLGMSVLGRFNQGMSGLALLLLVTQHSSYAVASAISAFFVGGSLISAPLLSRLADRIGRRRILAATAIVYSLVMLAMALLPPEPVLLGALALIGGLSTPPVTSSIRAALPALVAPSLRRGAFALEATAQELIFILGPPIAGVLAALGGPSLAVGASGAMVLVGTLGMVRDPKVNAGRHTDQHPKDAHVLRAPGIPGLMAAGALLTCALGAQVLGVVALVSGAQATSAAGWAIACGSLGSFVGGLIYGSRRRHQASLRHLLLLLAAGLVLLLAAQNKVMLVLLLFVWGLTVAPAMSCLLERLSSLAPPGTATELFGWMGSAFSIGNIAGTALAGVIVTAIDGHGAIAAAAAFAVLAAVVSEPWPAATRWFRRSKDRQRCAPERVQPRPSHDIR